MSERLVSRTPNWNFDNLYGMYYYYNAERQAFIYEDGTTVPCPRPVSDRYILEPHSIYAYPSNVERPQWLQADPRNGTHDVNQNFDGRTPPYSFDPNSNVRNESNSPDSTGNSFPTGLVPNFLANDLGQLSIFENGSCDGPSQRQLTTAEQKGTIAMESRSQASITPGQPLEPVTTYQPRSDSLQHNNLPQDKLTEEARLFSSFKQITKAKKFFSEGKVFMTLWVQPAADSNQSDISGSTAATSVAITKGRYGELVFSKVRRFVVVRESDLSCTAIPILTYGGKGVAKRGVKKSDHAIVYTGRHAPQETSFEVPSRGETGMRPTAIRVDVDHREDKLDIMSRIDFNRPYTIEHNLKVRSLGKVNRESLRPLIYQFNAVWAKDVGSRVPRHIVQPPQVFETPPASGETLRSGNIKADAIEYLIKIGYTAEAVSNELERCHVCSKGQHDLTKKYLNHDRAMKFDEGNAHDGVGWHGSSKIQQNGGLDL